jgi:hypothetical protein
VRRKAESIFPFKRDESMTVNHDLAHPNCYYPEIDWAQNQTLHVAVVYNNPCRWNKRLELFNDFRRHAESSANVKVYAGEIAYGQRPHLVTSPTHPRDFQFRATDQLWHKENLLNLVIQRFDRTWQYGAWIDADVIYTRHDWALETIHQLQTYDFVQLFSTYSNLKFDYSCKDILPGFMYGLRNNLDVNGRPIKDGYGKPGSPGLAWAFTRAAFNKVGGLLDTCILGSADHHMCIGLVGKPWEHRDHGISEEYRKSIKTWQERAAVLNFNIGFVDAHVIHHFHGDKNKRGYGDRHLILKDAKFDPYRDIYRDWQGLWQLTPNKPKLRDDIRRYFASRDEDGK